MKLARECVVTGLLLGTVFAGSATGFPDPPTSCCCWDTEGYSCCAGYPVNGHCGSQNCPPIYVANDFVRKLKVVESGYHFDDIPREADGHCTAYVGLCDYTSPTPQCTNADFTTSWNCSSYQLQTGTHTCP
jgi:hypothetical protein